MAKRTQGQINRSTGRVETAQVRKARRGDFDIAVVDTRGKRIARALWH